MIWSPSCCHFKLYWLTSDLRIMNGLYIIALLHDHLTKIRCRQVKIFAILISLGPGSIDHCLQVTTLYSLEKVVDFSVIINTTVSMICKALHIYVLFFGVWHTCCKHLFCLHHDSVSFATFFLLLWPVWLLGQGQEVAQECQRTELDCSA